MPRPRTRKLIVTILAVAVAANGLELAAQQYDQARRAAPLADKVVRVYPTHSRQGPSLLVEPVDSTAVVHTVMNGLFELGGRTAPASGVHHWPVNPTLISGNGNTSGTTGL